MGKLMCSLPVTLVIAGALYVGCLEPVEAQNVQCTTRPAGDSTNACASTSFVTGAIATAVTSLSLNQGAVFGGNAANIAIGKQVSLAVPVIPLSRATIQAAINENATFGAGGGGTLWIAAADGVIDTSTPLAISTGSLVIRCGGPAGTTGTALVASNVAGNMFTVTSAASLTMSECGITTAVTKDSGTAGIALDDTSTGDPQSKKFLHNLRINGQYDGIKIDDSFQVDLLSNLITNATHYGVVHTQPDVADAGAGWAIGNKIWSVSDVGAAAALAWKRGSRWVAAFNRLLGAFDTGFDIEFDKTTGDDGALAVIGNSFEVQDLYGSRWRRSAGAAAANRHIGQMIHALNFTQSLTAGYQSPFRIEQSNPGPWVDGAVISLNTVQNSINTLLGNCVYNLADGQGLSLVGNVIVNAGSGDGGYCTSGNATNVLIAHSVFVGGTVANRYPTINATTTIVDHIGLTTATLPATIANGSMIFDTTVGAMKLRQGGAWRQLAMIDATQTWTAVQTFPTPIFTTNHTSPLWIGGSGTTGIQATIKTTTGVGTTDSLAIVGGNNGATTFANFSAVGLNMLVGTNFNFGPGCADFGLGVTELCIGGGSGAQVLSFQVGGTLTGYFSVQTAGLSFFTNGAVPLSLGVNNSAEIQINGAATNVNITPATASTSTATGALTLNGANAGLGVAGAGYFGQEVVTGVTVVASLPACNAGRQGARYTVTNATATTFASTVAGGGANIVPVMCNGTNWIIGANDNDPFWKKRSVA